ncbi:hypothetical protein HGO38_04940 [Rhizobium sp. CG5]|uniref:flagellar hook-length control protein FliK n=1 Tax=Rhizobium sp. CG5 TaxID=2726076 RepID=UPI002033DCF0|nr:flagellar hook-length control protein FliK [Rhizobium sp. CG5]MCM2472823.1 hypothetical protein [Rhizobium sp. CG5]
MMDAGLSGNVAVADTKAYSAPARGSGTGASSSSKSGFSDELSKAASQKNATGDDQDTAIDADEDASELLADDGTSTDVSEDAADTVKTGSKVKPIFDISVAGLRKATDLAAPDGTGVDNTGAGTVDGDEPATDTTAAKTDRAEQVAKAALGALSDSAETTMTADEAAALQLAAKSGLGQTGTSEKTSTEAEQIEDGSKESKASDEDLEAVLSLLGGNTTATAEEVDAALAEAMADQIKASASSSDTAEETVTTDASSRSVGAIADGKTADGKTADGKTAAKSATASTPVTGNAVAQETTPTDEAFRAVRADAKYESAAVSVRSDNAAGADTKATTADTLPTVTVLDSRRYLAPAETSNAANIAASMMGDSDWASAMRAGTEATDATTGGGKVLNTLKIQMSPIDLGNVTATLRLVGDELSVSLVVENSAAYRKLSEDQNEIVKTLRAQGFSVDQVQISIVSSDKTASDTSQSGGQFSGQQSAQSGGQGGAANSRSQDTFSSSLGNDQTLGVSSDETTANQASVDGTRGAGSGQLYL